MDIDFNLWCTNNFQIVYDYGNLSNVFTDNDLLDVKKTFKKRNETNILPADDRKYLFQAVAALIGNIRSEYEMLTTRDINDTSALIKTLQDIIIARDNIDKVVFYAGKKKYPLENAELIRQIISALDRNYISQVRNQPAAERIVEKIKKVNGKKRGIPNLVNEVAYQLDYTFKRLMPKITTNAIIRDIFFAADFPNNYCDVRQIANFIKEGQPNV